MICPNCKNEINNKDDICPSCGCILDDDYSFGDINRTSLTNDINIQLPELKKNKKKNNKFIKILPFIILIIIVIGFGVYLFKNSYSLDKNKVFTYTFNELYDEFFDDSIFNENKGDYNLNISINGYKYEFEGKYNIDVSNKKGYLEGIFDNSQKDSTGIKEENEKIRYFLDLNEERLLLNSDYIYDTNLVYNLKSNDIYNNYNLKSIALNTKELITKTLMELSYEEESDQINYFGILTDVKRVRLNLNNQGKIELTKKLVNNLKDNKYLMETISAMTSKTNDEIIVELDKYINKKEYEYSSNTNRYDNINIYYKGTKVYGIDINYQNKKIRILIGSVKSTFDYYEDDVNIYSGTYSKVVDKDTKYSITFDKDGKVMDIVLRLNDINEKLEANIINGYKNINELNETEIENIKSKCINLKLDKIFS